MNEKYMCSEEILNSLVEGIITIDREFKVNFMNKAAARMTGLNANDVLGKSCKEVCKSNFCETECPISIVLERGKPVNDFNSKVLSPDGTTQPVKLNASVIKDEDDEPIGGVLSFHNFKNENEGLKIIPDSSHFYGIVGKSRAMQNVFKLITEISHTRAPVLIYGETGVGKELIADAIHKTSRRADKVFIKINCAVLPPNLLASELFGHVKGAFTDAIKDRTGRFEMADGGTIFLDEISEMSLNMQTQLLRVLQEGTFEKVGDSNTIKVDVRIIASSNRKLEEEIEKKTFREDLFYRLNVIPIYVPPLRERKEDVPHLVNYFINKFAKTYKKNIETIDDDALDLLMRYDWPGNIRELENTIEYAFIRSKKNKSICVCGLPHKIREGIECSTNEIFPVHKKIDCDNLIHLLKQHNGNKSKVAKILGVNRTTIWRALKKMENIS